MTLLLLTCLELICGSLMFSYWLGRLAKKDLSKVGDGNPGAFNLWSTAGYKWGITGVLLDFLKGYFPLVWIVQSGVVHGYGLILVAVAPIVGHAFSPFLKFKGGKAIATTFGVWSAITSFQVSFVYAIVLAVLLGLFTLLSKDRHVSDDANGFQVVFGFGLLLPYLLILDYPGYDCWIWALNGLLLIYTNRMKVWRYITGKTTG